MTPRTTSLEDMSQNHIGSTKAIKLTVSGMDDVSTASAGTISMATAAPMGLPKVPTMVADALPWMENQVAAIFVGELSKNGCPMAPRIYSVRLSTTSSGYNDTACGPASYQIASLLDQIGLYHSR
jgi:hypothetical protein